MTDEKDLEIARLRGQLEATQAKGGGAVTGTFKVLGTLIGIAIVGFIALIVIGNLLPDEPTYEEKAEKLAAQINARCDPKWTGSEEAAGECRLREFQIRGLPE